MSTMADEIQYQGRKARRAGSEQRRQQILEAALRIVVRDGIRGVRHRAVANEADVPLSSTTYYFKDMEDLIADTFTLFAERGMANVIDPFSEQVFGALASFDTRELGDPERRTELIDTLVEFTVAYIVNEVTEERDHLVAEQAFMQEAVRDERLRGPAQVYRDKVASVIRQGCEKLRTPAPEHDAELVLAFFQHTEAQLLVRTEAIDTDRLQAQVRNLFELLVGRGDHE